MSSWQPTRYSRAQLEERRLAALEWIERGEHKNQEIADHFGVSIHTVYSWKARRKRNGTLQATVAPGPVSRLDTGQLNQLSTLLREGAVHHGFPDETWTTKRVMELIGQYFDVWYHHDHVRKILRRLGFSPQKPDRLAVERNEDRITSWYEKVVPELEKKGRRRSNSGLSR